MERTEQRVSISKDLWDRLKTIGQELCMNPSEVLRLAINFYYNLSLLRRYPQLIVHNNVPHANSMLRIHPKHLERLKALQKQSGLNISEQIEACLEHFITCLHVEEMLVRDGNWLQWYI